MILQTLFKLSLIIKTRSPTIQSMTLTLFTVLLFLPLFVWLASFVYTSFRGSPYVPIKPKRLTDITRFIKKGDVVADLGAGDGRVLVEAIRRGAKLAHGWELDTLVWVTGWWRIRKSGVDTSKIAFHYGDFWHANLTGCDVIYVYQMTKYMKDFHDKLLPQLKKGALIVSPDYKIPRLREWKKVKDADRGIYVYKV